MSYYLIAAWITLMFLLGILLYFSTIRFQTCLLLNYKLKSYEKKHKSRLIVITDDVRSAELAYSCFVDLGLYIIDMDDSEKFYDFYSEVSSDVTLDIILHTSGGFIESSATIIDCLLSHQGLINMYIPRYACSAGTMIALCGHNIYMTNYAHMGPTDPIIGIGAADWQTKHIMDMAKLKKKSALDYDLLLQSFRATKIYNENLDELRNIFKKRHMYAFKNIDGLVHIFGSGCYYTHGKHFTVPFLKKNGLRINTKFTADMNSIISLLFLII